MRDSSCPEEEKLYVGKKLEQSKHHSKWRRCAHDSARGLWQTQSTGLSIHLPLAEASGLILRSCAPALFHQNDLSVEMLFLEMKIFLGNNCFTQEKSNKCLPTAGSERLITLFSPSFFQVVEEKILVWLSERCIFVESPAHEEKIHTSLFLPAQE